MTQPPADCEDTLASAPAPVMPRVRFFTLTVRVLVLVMAAVSGVSLLGMMLLTCVDVVMRATVNRPISGSQDLVSVTAIIVLAGAMPYTTACRGHVTVDYFSNKFPRGLKWGVTKVLLLVSLALFALLCYQAVIYGQEKLKVGEVTSTLQLPMFWLPWVLAASCGGMVLVFLHELLYPGAEIVKP